MKTLATAFFAIFLTVSSLQAQLLQLPPVLVSPVNAATNVSLTPTLTWNLTLAAGNLLYFKVQVAADADFTEIIHQQQVTQHLLQLPQNLLEHNRTYYWRVQAVINLGLINITTNFSSPFSFTTTIFTGITQINSSVPGSYKLYDNYPNPFNPETNIKFDVKENTGVKLLVYSITGEVVSELVNSNMQAGTYEAKWNASGVSSGIYFYQLTAGNFSATKKMILTK